MNQETTAATVAKREKNPANSIGRSDESVIGDYDRVEVQVLSFLFRSLYSYACNRDMAL